ncbi:MAG: hypothetical protein JXA90_11965 [Planctomycetes bacterium]|nr:hypothetical protein [Planctomycetota bacterium]
MPHNIRMEGGWSFTGWTDWAYSIGNFHEKYLLAIMNPSRRRAARTTRATCAGSGRRR